jgi:hypothetical protein
VRFARSIRWFDAVVLGAAAFLSFGAVMAKTLSPKSEAEPAVAVIFAPWTDAREALSRTADAGGRFVRFGAFDFIAVIEPSNRNFAREIRAQGAWFIADPVALAACLQPIARNRV